MGFFDNVGQSISNKSAAAAQKVKDVTEMSRLNGVISTEEKNINEQYTLIGKKFYEANLAEPGEYVNFFNNIKESLDKIEDARKQIAALKKTVTCPGCGNEVDKSSAFCNKCGYNMAQVIAAANPAAAPTVHTCPQCNAEVDADAKFCNACGAKLS